MAIYQDIIQTIGDTLSEYNVGAWALFRDQVATDISNQYIFGGGRREDESILLHNAPYISESNEIVRGQLNDDSRFVYYTQEGPKYELEGGPVLADQDKRINGEHKINVSDGTQKRLESGIIELNVFDEHGNINNPSNISTLDNVQYGTNVTRYNNGETLLSKTKKWFKYNESDYISHRYASLISRFHSDDNQQSQEDLRESVGIQAFSSKYGLSRGRNLLKKNHDNENTNGYSDPYCRVWTWHKQYHKYVQDTMRPLGEDGKVLRQGQLNSDFGWGMFRSNSSDSFGDGGTRLSKYGVMYDNSRNTNGLVNITPSFDKDASSYRDHRNVSVEHCMFSIENLAWKGLFSMDDRGDDVNGLSSEQKGPLGGRIMWFPPYDIKFTENSQANWQPNEFIGRGEPIYTYANTHRSGTLSFKLLIDHPAILDYWEKRNVVNNYSTGNSGVDDVDSPEQELLRFFAGCDVLSAKPKPQQENNSNQNNTQEENQATNTGKFIRFFVFYPNNYSGVDDKVNGIVDPISYILNGVGAQKYDTSDKPEDYGKPGVTFDLQTDVTSFYKDEHNRQVGGYEVRDCGISIVTSQTNDNKITEVTNGDNAYTLVKMVGSAADKKPTGETKEWNKKRYYYRADNSTLNQILTGDADNGAVSYIDKKSLYLNSSGYTEAISQFNIVDSGSVYSLLEVFVALKNDSNGVFSGLYNQGRVNQLKSIFKKKKGKITKIVCRGSASPQGNNPSTTTNKNRNRSLAEHRATTIKNWLEKNMDLDGVGIECYSESPYKSKDFVTDDSNNEFAKLTRYAVVEIEYTADEVGFADQTNIHVDETNSASSLVRKNSNGNAVIQDEGESAKVAITSDLDNVRYDNEARFFEKLPENAPFITKLISQRIKNFDPVFHSMSPEGFNARLTFLNQCLRQGPTLSGTETNGYNANNLAFGRPPVCVLRVGDFYNTKIIITNMTIDYDPLVWDLNHEGIGVMPMIANISLQFYFIGGSDLAGPIQRLQNAASFNYYANASVYDNRAEEIEYSGGEPNKFKSFDPNIPYNDDI